MSTEATVSSKNIVRGGRGTRGPARRSRSATSPLLLIIPVIVIVVKAFEDGIGNVIDTLTTPEAQHAFYLTIVMVAIAVPLNTIFGDRLRAGARAPEVPRQGVSSTR